MPAADLTIRLDQLANGPVSEERALPTDWCAERLGDDFRPTTPTFAVRVKARKHADVVQADCVLTGAYALGCSKCGDGLQLPFEVAFTQRFVPPGSVGDDDDGYGDLFADDPDLSEHDGQRIDLLPVCIEHAILALPQAPSCADLPSGPCEKWTDEPARFGDELPEDEEDESPWAALRSLQLPSKEPAEG